MTDDLTRRDALRTIAVGAAATLVTGPGAGANPGTVAGAAGASAPVFFTPREMEVLGLLVERIIPTDEHSPGARAAGVPERIDAVLKGVPAGDQKGWHDGLAALEALCRERFSRSLSEVGEAEQDALLSGLAEREARPGTLTERFFVALKSQTVEAYYTSKIGLRDELQYRGNTYLADFPGCTHEKHKG